MIKYVFSHPFRHYDKIRVALLICCHLYKHEAEQSKIEKIIIFFYFTDFLLLRPKLNSTPRFSSHLKVNASSGSIGNVDNSILKQ
jgi:hypothetical protein